ncbi:hypothetical protein [Parasphingorhabdus sp.]|uniref:hypothetical protein n=1 Tax=Parasphingorhabdus sp. TaxID=2709688 RepID=UPI003D26DDD6
MQIPIKVTERLLDSVAFLNSQYGVAFNAMVTMNFGQLGISGKSDKSLALTKMNQSLSRKIDRHAKNRRTEDQHHYLFAHECSRDHGHHVHEVIVAPGVLALGLQPWLTNWARRHFGSGIDPKAIHFDGRSHWQYEKIARNQSRIVGYILKTTEPTAVISRHGHASYLHTLLGRKRSQHSFPMDVDKIAGTSQSISIQSQWDAGYQPEENWEDLLSEDNLIKYVRRRDSEELIEQLRRIQN